MLCHGFDKLVEDETLIVQFGRLAQLEILSDGLDWTRDLVTQRSRSRFWFVVTVVNKMWKECEISYDEVCLELKLSNSQKPKTGPKN